MAWTGCVCRPVEPHLGFAVLFLARLLGNLYFINNIRHEALNARFRRQLIADAVPFLVFFLAFVIRTLLKDGFAVDPETGQIVMEPFKYFHNFMAMPYLLVLFLLGVVGVLYGLGKAFSARPIPAVSGLPVWVRY